MRKFVNKKRQKRKYTKKSEVTSAYSSAKTAYSMIPLLIMLIAFMSTLVISAPLRDSLENIKFTFTLPQFSLSNPLPFFETAWGDITQIGIVSWTIMQIAGVTIAQSLISITQKITYGIILISHFLILSGSGIGNSLQYMLKEFLFGIQLIYEGITFVLAECGLAIDFTLQTITAAAITAGQFFAKTTLSLSNAILHFSLLAIHYIMIAALAVTHFIAIIVAIIWKSLVFTAVSISTFFTHVFTAIVRVIEIPFKTIYTFWIAIKPYVNFFGDHVKMSGNDFSNMVTSLGKVSSLVGVGK